MRSLVVVRVLTLDEGRRCGRRRKGRGRSPTRAALSRRCNTAKSGKVAIRASRAASSEGAWRRDLQASESEVSRAAPKNYKVSSGPARHLGPWSGSFRWS